MGLEPKAAVFDAYGTLFDVAGALRHVAEGDPGASWAADWQGLARLWRQKQLEITWLRAAAGRHSDFATVTADALDWTLARAGLSEPDLRELLLELYAALPAYPEARAAVEALRAKGLTCAILTNATPGMIAGLLDASGFAPLFDAVLTVEEAGVYKPHPSVYALATARFGVLPEEVLFVSANAWDAAGAAGFGFRTAWINREGAPPDPLWARPNWTLPSLDTLPELI
ncbi:haloacid dehalogenase type II [Rubellimicrobium roseum]|uniref:(S)-2-haloacid dehalogenase n=1 Tax=Rubellimicrobium roseum TaxID=687525 RepID=A0A5C4NF45_9RHOB|nr:haloacid dehalogenase type II [Rubellimicrobium roseum]TNC69862.1 haloacid dehalogenase type II [Rubellimicrobium roseum]